MSSTKLNKVGINCQKEVLPVTEVVWYIDTEATKDPAAAAAKEGNMAPAAKAKSPLTKEGSGPVASSSSSQLPLATRSWVMLAAEDSKALETALRAGDPEVKVPIRGDLLDVNVHDRVAEPVYWSGAPQYVLRGTWFVEESSLWQPLEEYLADEIERQFLQRPWTTIPDGQLCARWLLEDRLTTVLFFSKDDVRLVRSGMLSRIDLAMRGEHAASLPLRRGGEMLYITQADKVPPQQSRNFKHLVLVLHGIGQRLDFNDICVEVGMIRSTLLGHAKAAYQSQVDAESFQVLPVQWRKNLDLSCDMQGNGETSIDDVTVSQLSLLRSVLNGTIVDVLVFMTPRLRRQIQATAVSEMNRIYNLFVSRNPSFKENGGQVHFLPHSLGTVIAFDILVPTTSSRASFNANSRDSPEIAALEEQLFKLRNVEREKALQMDFSVTNVFAIGSPLGIFLTVQGTRISDRPGPGNVMPRTKAWFNIYNGYDPVAYRLEPTIARHLALRKPRYVPWFKGGQKLHIQMQDYGEKFAMKVNGLKAAVSSISFFGKAVTVSEAEAAASSASQTLVASPSEEAKFLRPVVSDEEATRILNKLGDGAVDYLLQDEALEAPYVSAVMAHLAYWNSLDVAAFILARIYKTNVSPPS